MNKISVIIAHEYTTRVRSKWFIISTLLGPVILALMIAIPVVAAMLAGEGETGKVAVVDKANGLGAALVNVDTSKFEAAGDRTEAQLSDLVRTEALQAYLVVPANVLEDGRPMLYSRGGTGIAFEESIENDLEPLVTQARLQRAGTDTSVISLVEKGVSLSALKLTEEGVEQDASKASAAIGYVAGFVIYMLIFLYGSMVMRGVVEEKANRIVEVLASSARPYHIMMGKVVGIGLVGLTQMVAWLALGSVVVLVLGQVFAGSVDPQQTAQQLQQLQAMQGQQADMTKTMIGGIALPSISIGSILLFLFYFLAGYFLYATLFAAVGSAVDQEADANQLTLPVTLPVVITMLFIGNVVASPNGTLAVVMSLIPLFTPILMTVRVAATDVPLWQILTSVVLSTVAFFGAVWLASRIYRIGILSYGRKPSFKDIAKWIRISV